MRKTRFCILNFEMKLHQFFELVDYKKSIIYLVIIIVNHVITFSQLTNITLKLWANTFSIQDNPFNVPNSITSL